MTTPEGKMKDKIKKLLHRYKVYFHMPVQNGMGAPTLDFICCHWGFYIGIEAKAPKKDLTDRQYITKGEIENAGGIVLRVSSDEELDILECYLQILEPSP
jgi:hypothetical protein